MIKVLTIVWYKVLPPKYGGQKGIALFTKYLSHFYDVIFVCSKDNEPGDMPFKVLNKLPVSKFQFLNPLIWIRIVLIAKKNQPSWIIVEHPYHGIAGFLAARESRSKLIVHSHNIESQRFRLLNRWWWHWFLYYEKWTHQKADLCLFKTEKDLRWAVKNFNVDENKSFVVPYGIGGKPFIDRSIARQIICDRLSLPEETKILLFAGTLDYMPNAKAVELIFKEIAPGLSKKYGSGFRILICGRNQSEKFQYLKKFFHHNVLYIGEVDDIQTYFAAADVFLDPVQKGGGIQSKIIEALSYNLNIACFKEQVDEKLIKLAGEKIFASASDEESNLIESISCALQEKSLTPATFFDYYDWKNIISRLNEKLIKRKLGE